MGITAVAGPTTPLAGSEVEPVAVTAATAAAQPAATTGATATALAAALVFAGTGAATTYSQGDPDFELVTFSKPSAANAILGLSDDSEVNTIYFRKVGNTLIPLKAIRPQGDFGRLDKNALTFEDAGEPIAISMSLPSQTEFLDLHSLDQIVFVQLLGQTHGVPADAPEFSYRSLSFGEGDPPDLTIVLSQDGRQLHMVDKLQGRDFSFMPVRDQAAIADTAAFGKIAATLGLTTDRAAATGLVDQLIAHILQQFPDSVSYTYPGDPNGRRLIVNGQYVNATIAGDAARVGYMTTQHRQLFLDQLALIADEINNDMAVFNLTQINDRVGDIKERFDRALAYGDIPIAGQYVDGSLVIFDDPTIAGGRFLSTHEQGDVFGFPDMLSHDGNQIVKDGFDTFMRQEQIYAEATKSRRALIKDISAGNLAFDGPTVLYRLQAFYEQTAKANTACAQEELRQQNDLLKSYSIAQKAISEQVAQNKNTRYMGWKYHHPAWGGRSANDLTDDPWSYWSQADAKLIAMFQTNNGKSGLLAPLHPIEKLAGITRQRFDLVTTQFIDPLFGPLGGGVVFKHGVATWQQWGNQLSENVNMLNQQTQILANRINGFQKDENRANDLASNTLRKLLDMLMSAGNKIG